MNAVWIIGRAVWIAGWRQRHTGSFGFGSGFFYNNVSRCSCSRDGEIRRWAPASRDKEQGHCDRRDVREELAWAQASSTVCQPDFAYNLRSSSQRSNPSDEPGRLSCHYALTYGRLRFIGFGLLLHVIYQRWSWWRRTGDVWRASLVSKYELKAEHRTLTVRPVLDASHDWIIRDEKDVQWARALAPSVQCCQ